jgi:tetratricopeptide (TPR) repeat protein
VRPDAPNARSDYATMLWYSGHHQEAERQWLLAFDYKPDTAEVLANLGMAKLDEGKYDEAIAYLQKAIQLKPNFATPHVHLGRVYLAQAKPADAEKEFLRAVDIYPADVEARKALGQFYLDFGRLPEAEAQFLAAREVAADFSTWCALGEIYARENRPDQEEDALRHAVSLEPFDPKAHLSLGRIYLSKGQYPEAQKEFEACLLMQPANQEALAGMGKLNTLGQLHTSSTGSAR